ncbi:MAG: hypothetical protein ISS16_08785 [Ignavibacteria bacterium]|nr:hypothetical protein [Ignavibacteria bacterium]
MKKLIPVLLILFLSLIVLLIFCCFTVQAQQTIEYDFLNNKLVNKDLNAENGELVVFKVIDVNPFLYEVSIKQEGYDYNTTVPVLFKTYFNITEDEKSVLRSVLEDVKGETGKKESGAYTSFMKSVNVYENYVSAYEELLALVHIDGLSIKEIVESKEEITGKEDAGFLKDIKNNIEVIDSIHRNYSDEDIDYIYETLEAAGFKNLPLDMKKLLTKINPGSFSFSASPVTAEKDVIIYEITITPIENEDVEKYGSGSKEVSFKVPVEVLGGFKIDFSTGLFVSNLIDHKYAITGDSIFSANDTLRGYRILRNEEGKIKIGLSAMMHLYYRFSSIINVGLNIGVGIIPDQSVSYLGGGSLIFGNKNRFIISGGVMLGSVERLSSLIKEKNLYPDIPLQNNLTVKELDLGWYLGISYNL